MRLSLAFGQANCGCVFVLNLLTGVIMADDLPWRAAPPRAVMCRICQWKHQTTKPLSVQQVLLEPLQPTHAQQASRNNIIWARLRRFREDRFMLLCLPPEIHMFLLQVLDSLVLFISQLTHYEAVPSPIFLLQDILRASPAHACS